MFGRHRWRQLHYTAYALAFVAYSHGIMADPLLKNRPIDFIDAEKVYVEGCAAAVLLATLVVAPRAENAGKRPDTTRRAHPRS
jgi:DMSO/TMAO reductase YedYZ heme-binding membrane subunit